MSFPNPPVPDQEYTHSNGITYIYSSSKGAWEIKYQAATNTASLPLANPTGTFLLTGSQSLPDTGGLLTQSHYNEWAFNSLVKVDETSRVDAGEDAPGDADTNQLWYKPSTGSLYVYYNDGSSTQWVEIGGSTGGLDDAPIDGTLYGRQDGAWAEVIGGGGEESQPFIKWHQFAVIERSSRFDYDPIWEVNANSSNNGWEYQIDLQGNGTWQEVSGLGEPFHTQIGWYGSMTSSHLRLNKVDSQNNLYPNAKVRFFVTTELNGVTNTDYSCELPAWTGGQCDYSSAVAELSQRVSQGEEIQSEVLSTVQQIQVQAGLHQLNLDNINADQVTQNQDIESLQNQVNELEIVKGALATYDCFATSLPYNARPGECMFNDTTASAVIVLGFGVENKDGVLTKSMEDGDIIEVIAPGGVVSRYTIVDATSAPQMVAVSFVSGEQTFGIGTEYSVYIYPQNAAGVSKDYVDAQNQLQDDVTVKLNTPNNQTTNDFRLKVPNGNIALSTSNGSQIGIYHLRDASEDHHAISRGYADARYTTPAYVDNYLPLAGGDMSGVINLKGDARIKGRDTNDDVKLTIYPSGLIESSSGIRSDVDSSGANCFEARNNGSINLYVQGSGKAVSNYAVTSADIDGTLATKKYVDDNAGGNINLDNYVEKTGSVMTGQLTINRDSAANALRIQQNGTNLFRVYPGNGEGRVEIYSGKVFKLLATVNGVNSQIAKVYDDGEIRIFHHKDPTNDTDVVNRRWSYHNGMRWTHANHTDAGSLVAGEFFVASNGHIYMHGVSKDGIDIKPGSTATEEDGLKFFCSIHRPNGDSAYLITTNKVAFNQGSNNYIRIEKLHAHLGDSTTQGETYRLNIPGFTY